MAEATLKTRKNKRSVAAFVNAIKDPVRREECRKVLKLMRTATGARPAMWGPTIVGFGSYHYRYASGREGDWFLTGFSPRKSALTIYIMAGLRNYRPLLKSLGRHSIGSSCLYIRSLENIDMKVLDKLVKQSVRDLRKRKEG
ncbi:MAG: hypothetical protein HBSIN02_08690 [Bacteroidia bacterium]|nr:MAG: hypothetical protein HBSIN02_08690 [Bacteroidia bacterium]